MSNAKAHITFFGHSTVLIESEHGTKVMIDPFLDGNPSCPSELQDPGQIDVICLSHGHGDHASSAVTLAKKYGPKVCATFELANLLIADGVPEGNVEFMNKGGCVAIAENGLKIHMTNAFHSSSYISSDGTNHYAGEAAGIVVELESGRTIYHAGDTCLFGDMKLIGDRFKPALALLPVGDRFTMGPEDAATAAKLVQASTVIPIHHSTFPGLSGTPEDFAKQLENTSIDLQLLAPGQTYEL